MSANDSPIAVELGRESLLRSEHIFSAEAFRVGRIMEKGLEEFITVEIRGARGGEPANTLLLFSEDMLARLLVEVMSLVKSTGPEAMDRWSTAMARWIAIDLVNEVLKPRKSQQSTRDDE